MTVLCREGLNSNTSYNQADITALEPFTWSRKLRVTSLDKQASMHAPRFSTQSK